MSANPGSMWLVKDGDLFIGPYGISDITEKLLNGQLSSSCPAQEVGGSGALVSLEEIAEQLGDQALSDAFHQAVRRELFERQNEISRGHERRTRRIVGAIVLVLALGLAAVVAYVGQNMAVHADADEPLALEITVEAPEIVEAKKSNEELIAYGDYAKRAAADRRQRARAAAPKGKLLTSTDSEGMEVGQVDVAGLTAVAARNKPTLIPCIRQAVDPRASATRIPIAFSVTNGGKVAKVWVDSRDLHDDANLNACLLRELQKWSFPAGSAGATISLAFNVGPRR